MNEEVDFLVEAKRIFDRGLKVTTTLLHIAKFEAKGAKVNAEEFRAIVNSDAFR